MSIFDAVILGIVEGITEFLPISSTGHLIIVSDWLGLEQNSQNKAFDVIIQFAAILAVVVNYKDKFTLKHTPLWIKVFISFLPLAIVGFIFKDQIKALFDSYVVAVMFIVGGVIFIVIEYFHEDKNIKVHNIEDVSYRDSIWIGVAQVFALIPGTSRAGATIIGSLLLGMSRRVSAEYSFLLALPVMGAVSGYDFLKHYNDFSNENLMALGVGFVVSFVIAYFVMKLFVKFLERFTFVAFGVYRILFGLALLIYL